MNGYQVFDFIAVPIMVICLIIGGITAFLIFSGSWQEAYGQIELNTDSQGSAAGSLNDGFGDFSASLRGMLDAFYNIDVAFQETIKWLRGTFLGDWEE